MDKLEFYRIEDRKSEKPFLANSDLTLKNVWSQVSQFHNQEFTIYFQWKPLDLPTYGELTLRQIAEQDASSNSPVFYVYDHVTEQSHSEVTQKYGFAVAKHQQSCEDPKQFWIGTNGHVLFDTRKTALLASSVAHASKKQQYQGMHRTIVKNYSSSIIKENSQIVEEDEGMVKRVLSKLGIIRSKPTAKNLMNTIEAIKKIDNEESLKSHIDREYSDYDINFAAYLEAVYIRFAVLNRYRMHYIEYKQLEEGIIQYKVPQNAKIAIIGDYGTGLPDSINLLKDLIINKEVDIILHLGDVYYAGTPHQYEEHVTKPLQELRKLAKEKISPNKDVLFYSIPGNHDYYSWGLPFLTFTFNINENKLQKQRASYFCLRTEGDRWQFIGLDTAYHDSNPMSQINGLALGPHVRHKQVEWFNHKMETFSGSTVLLTHHQIFSIHDRICGSLSQYRQFSCLNPLISAQLFKYLPHISGWYWGHQHAFMLFEEGVMGLPKCRLLGNSSFHVFMGDGPYKRKPNFPHIPLIQPDEEYMKKYLPMNPPDSSKQTYYNLCYALIDLSKEKRVHSEGMFASFLPVSYYCCPCFSSEEAELPHFEPYLLYQQYIKPKVSSIMIVNEEADITLNCHEEDRFRDIKAGDPIQLKTEIGLFVDQNETLNLQGCKLVVRIINSSWSQQETDQNLKDILIDGSVISFEVSQKQQTSDKMGVLFGHQYIICKKRVLQDKFIQIRAGDSFTLQDNKTKEFLGCSISNQVRLKAYPQKQEQNYQACLFQFFKDSKVLKGNLVVSQEPAQ